MDRLTGLVGLVLWQEVQSPWIAQAVEVCLENIRATENDDAHTILGAFCLLEGLAGWRDVEPLFQRLVDQLAAARFFCAHAPVTEYGLTPLDFAPRPGSFCQRLFTQAQIDAHLDDLAARQQEDGGWPIQWDPPGEMARWEWRGHMTVNALCTLRAYGRI